ncbi:hypothetical protein BDP27DRAFT_1317093 [Rhodocollybia butyracea]|uniref:DUF6533 domain-containing protein n=1 Tax=Rhodocollybia butyracea TaxID=206335 RepID=A0A9P5Q5H2_9AGAR|nr:hypothetical protein BDP27DRAFT_1317093 [Rhodocollybia butyracea]
MKMSTISLTNSQSLALAQCIAHGRMGQGISYATTTLFLYDYSLTVWDEAKYVWGPKQFSVGMAAFILARYGALAGTIFLLLPDTTSPAMESTATVLRLISVISSEFIVAIRTWAIWCGCRRISITLAFFSSAAIIPAAVIIGESIATNRVVPLVSPEFIDICSSTISNITQAYVVPYILTILYESVTLTLSLIRILTWRKTISKEVRTPLLDTLWRDGVLYFSFMLLLGFLNIGIVLQSGAPQLRTGCAQLQAVIHSILSTRIVLHMRDVKAHGCSVLQTDDRVTTIEFTNPNFNASIISDDDASEDVMDSAYEV